MKISQRVSELSRDLISNIQKISVGHNSVKSVGRSMVLALCISSNHALYLYKVS